MEVKLKDILAISGQAGLYRYIARSRGGVIVESLVDGRRTNASGTTSKISSMAEISIYTDDADVPLATLFENLSKECGGKEAISPKASETELRALFDKVIPHYDRDRFHLSDMRKALGWYNILVGAGITDFSIEEETSEAKAE
ncbi:MAG: DUF5606 domain-containing protein [Tidjanibacter sp.]|nr:DUF5606 domain-containing protein [Tidjanibacter sp.]